MQNIEYPQNETISKYEGSVKNGVPWGKGTLTYKNGDIYLGEFENGEKNGFGLLIFAEDDEDEAQLTFRGIFENDQRQGNGTMIWKNGEKYVGNWKNDQRSGQGSYSLFVYDEQL